MAQPGGPACQSKTKDMLRRQEPVWFFAHRVGSWFLFDVFTGSLASHGCPCESGRTLGEVPQVGLHLVIRHKNFHVVKHLVDPEKRGGDSLGKLSS